MHGVSYDEPRMTSWYGDVAYKYSGTIQDANPQVIILFTLYFLLHATVFIYCTLIVLMRNIRKKLIRQMAFVSLRVN